MIELRNVIPNSVTKPTIEPSESTPPVANTASTPPTRAKGRLTRTSSRFRQFRVTIDGKPPASDHGSDIDDAGNGTIEGQRLYQLVRQKGAVRERTFAIEFLDPGALGFAFTFG